MWTPLPVGGEPNFANLSQGYITPRFLFFLLFKDSLGWTLGLIFQFAIAGFGTFLFCRQALGFFPSVFAGLTFMACGFNSSWSQWQYFMTSCWIPWISLAGARLAVMPTLKKTGILAFFVALLILGAFPAVAGYALYMGGFLFLVLSLQAWRSHRDSSLLLKTLFFGSIALGLGILICTFQLMPFKQMLSEYDLTSRIGGYGIGLRALGRLLFPLRHHLAHVEFTGYVGILGLGLALSSFLLMGFRKAGYLRQTPLFPAFWVGFSVFSLLVIVGETSLIKEICARLPVFNFNNNGRMLSVFDFSMAVLAGISFDMLWRKGLEGFPPRRKLFMVFAVGAVLFQGADLARVLRYQNAVVPEQAFFPIPETVRYTASHILPGQSVLATTGPFMMPGTLGNYGLSEWFAHDFKRNNEKAVLEQIVSNPWMSATSASFDFIQVNMASPWIDLLGTRYVLTSRSEIQVAGSARKWPGWHLAFESELMEVLERDRSPAGAYLISQLALTDSPQGAQPRWSDVSVQKHEAEHQIYEVKVATASYLVMTMRVWSGWSAWVDGQPAQIAAYQKILPAVLLTPGMHRVELKYEEPFWRLWLMISGLAFIFTMVLIISTGKPPLADRRTQSPPPQS
ncbi:hypothetical protein WDW37_20100 [Bdellovibrionota bacterium FG-1]